MVNNLVVQVEEMAKNISEMRIEIHELRNALLKVTSQEKERQGPSTEKVQKKMTNKMSETQRAIMCMSPTGSHAYKEGANTDGDIGEGLGLAQNPCEKSKDKHASPGVALLKR